VLEERFPETVETQPDLLAYHYTEAGLIEQAILYWQRVGQRAVERSANEEGLSVLAEALAIVNKTGERFYEAELYRLKGELTLAQSSVQGLASPAPNT